MRGQHAAPVSGLADFVLGILERGVVIGLRLEGPPGDRRLMVGLGTPESAEALMLALGFTSLFSRPQYSRDVYEAEWGDPYQ